jgi:hypothetical protein
MRQRQEADRQRHQQCVTAQVPGLAADFPADVVFVHGSSLGDMSQFLQALRISPASVRSQTIHDALPLACKPSQIRHLIKPMARY